MLSDRLVRLVPDAMIMMAGLRVSSGVFPKFNKMTKN